jgi:TRAP-type C4-dicarboxylate transport system permease small subunit
VVHLQKKKQEGRLIMEILFQTVKRFGDPIWGIVIPAVVLFFSILFTWLLYKKFSKQKK